jgi:hypothetical protein
MTRRLEKKRFGRVDGWKWTLMFRMNMRLTPVAIGSPMIGK